jgi:hypothetical protein
MKSADKLKWIDAKLKPILKEFKKKEIGINIQIIFMDGNKRYSAFLAAMAAVDVIECCKDQNFDTLKQLHGVRVRNE